VETIQQIWQDNKRFLLKVGGGFAIFLLLRTCVVESYIDGAGLIHRRNQKTEQGINRLRNELIQRAPEEKKNLEELLEIEKELGKRYLTPPPAVVPDPRLGSPQIQFSERIDRIWGELRASADQTNVKIPEKITTSDLSVYAGNSPADHERSAAYLGILERALKTCIDSGMTQIGKPAIFQEEGSGIAENEGFLVVYRRVGLTVYGPYQAFKRVLRAYQDPPFTQVRLTNQDTKGPADSGLLRGTLEFVGIHLEKEVAEGGEGAAAKKSARRKIQASPGGPSRASSSRWRK